jgi:hypothetical protein
MLDVRALTSVIHWGAQETGYDQKLGMLYYSPEKRWQVSAQAVRKAGELDRRQVAREGPQRSGLGWKLCKW